MSDAGFSDTGTTDVVLALDAGGTKLLGGLVTAGGAVLGREQRPTPRSAEGCDPGLVALTGLARVLVEAAGARGLRVVGTGLGIAEYVRSNRVTSAEVFRWQVQPADALAAVSPGLVFVETDVRCAALADLAARQDGQSGCAVYVSWGTGLSSCVIVDGECVPGRRGEALALGEWRVDPRVAADWDGNLEQFASGHGMGRRLEQATGRPSSGALVAELATQGDPVARAIRDSAAAAVAAALAALVQVLDPDLIVLGGGIGVHGDPLPQLVGAALPALLHRPDPPPVTRSAAGSDAGLLGAAVLAWRGVEASARP